MTTIQIELPEATAQAARDAGLLTGQALDRLLNDALRRKQAADALLSIADRVAAAGIAPMSMEGARGFDKLIRNRLPCFMRRGWRAAPWTTQPERMVVRGEWHD